MKIRSLLIGVFFFLAFFLIIGKLYWLQVVDASMLREKAANKWTNEEMLLPVRGTIMDRKDRVLAEDAPAYTVALNPEVINERGIAREIAHGLAPILSLSADAGKISELEEKIYGLATKKRADYPDKYALEVPINSEGKKIDGDKKQQVEDFIAKLKDDLKESKGKIRDVGIFLKETEKRYYPNDNLASHVLGYVNREGAAVEGLEKYLDDQLKGTPGKLVREKDRMGVELPDSKVSLDPVVNGKNVRLTIDNKIQYFTENALKKAMDKWKAKSMTAIAVDPKTMEILAMANAPDFNPNKFWEAKSQANFTNHAVASAYEPGSTFKLVTLAGAIQEGLWHPNDKYQSGSIAIPGGAVHDHNRVGWGKISFMEGLLRSSNVAFVKLGYEGLKREGLDSWIAKFGFGKKTGIAMPGEVGGVTGLKYDSDYARATYGQSLTVTALQQTAAYAAIANGGKLMKPQLIKEIINPETKEVEKSFAPEVIRQVVTEETARQTSLALEQVVANQEQGTGRRAYINGYRVAGKTGTANIVKDGERTYSEDTWLISFIGYAPVDDPKILVAVIADQPELGGDYHLGGEVAAPVFKEIVSQSLSYMGVPTEGAPLKNPAVSEAVAPVPDVIGKDLSEAKKTLEKIGFKVELVGSGGKVVSQMPQAGSEILLSQRIYLGAEDAASTEIPDLKGKSLRDALEVCSMLGVACKTSGEGYVASQTVSGEGDQRLLQLELSLAVAQGGTPDSGQTTAREGPVSAASSKEQTGKKPAGNASPSPTPTPKKDSR